MPAGYTDVIFSVKELINGEPNPETKAVYSKRKLRQQMIIWVKQAERAAAIEAVPDATEIDINE
jgi:hypothetical protein